MAMFSFFSLLITSSLLLLLSASTISQENAAPDARMRGTPLAPALFIFGDSLIDNGNNNDLPSFAKANYYPYGIDFPDGPSGRFSNGYTIVDEIAHLLGLPLIPPFSKASEESALHGVNYASAAAGILDVTGRNFIGRIPFNQQICNFEITVKNLSIQLGADLASKFVSESIFFVGMGSNDYLNNYLLPNYNTRNEYDNQQFASLLVKEYALQLKRLYHLGARKFVITGIGLLGCIPSILAQTSDGHCSDYVNNLVLPFNSNVQSMLSNLNANLTAARFIYLDVFLMLQEIIGDPGTYGFSVVDRGCCGLGRNSGQITCLPFQSPCSDRDRYVFWDAFHPTSAISVILARNAFAGDRRSVHPMNIQRLTQVRVDTVVTRHVHFL